MERRSPQIRLQRPKGRLGNYAARGLLDRTENVQPLLTARHVGALKWRQLAIFERPFVFVSKRVCVRNHFNVFHLQIYISMQSKLA